MISPPELPPQLRVGDTFTFLGRTVEVEEMVESDEGALIYTKWIEDEDGEEE